MSPGGQSAEGRKRRKNFVPFDLYTDNQFDGLPENDSDLDSVASSLVHGQQNQRARARLHRQNHHNFVQHVQNSQRAPAHTNLVSKKKVLPPPPIIIENTRIQQLIEHVKPLALPADKLKYKLSKSCIRIYTADKETFDAVCAQIKTQNVPGFTHTPKEDRYTRFCLYGLYPMNVDLLKPELKKHLIEPDKIRLMY